MWFTYARLYFQLPSKQIDDCCYSIGIPMATSVEIPRLKTENNVLDFESNSNDTTSSCTSSSVDQDLPSEPKSEDSAEQISDAGTLF